MAAAYDSHTTGTNSSSSSYEITCTIPGSDDSTDILMAFCVSDGSAAWFPVDTGWISIGNQNNAVYSEGRGRWRYGNTVSTAVFWRYDPTGLDTQTFYTTDEEQSCMAIVRITGAVGANPISRVDVSIEASMTPTCPALTTNLDNDSLVIRFTGYDDGTAQDASPTVPSGHTSIVEHRSANNTAGCGMVLSYITANPSTSVAAADHDITQSEQSCNYTIAIATESTSAPMLNEVKYAFPGGDVYGILADGETEENATVYGMWLDPAIGTTEFYLTDHQSWGSETYKQEQSTNTKVDNHTYTFKVEKNANWTLPKDLYLHARNMFSGEAVYEPTNAGIPVRLLDSEPATDQDVYVERGILVTPTSGTDENVDVTDLSADTKFLYLYGCTATGDDTSSVDAQFFWSLIDLDAGGVPTPVYRTGAMMINGTVDAAENYGWFDDDNALVILDDSLAYASAAEGVRADTASSITGGFRLHFNLTDGNAYRIHYIAMGGNDVDGSIEHFDPDNTEDGTNPTDPGFVTNAAIVGTAIGIASFDSKISISQQCVGFMGSHGDLHRPYSSDMGQFSVSIHGGTSASSASRKSIVLADTVANYNSGSSWYWGGAFEYITPHGEIAFYAPNETARIAILKLRLGENYHGKKAVVWEKTTAGTQDIPDLGFEASTILMVTARETLDTINDNESVSSGVALSMGSAEKNGTQESFLITAATSSTNIDEIIDQDKILIYDADAGTTLDVRASIQDWTGDNSPSVVFSPHTDTAQYKIGIFAVEEGPASAGPVIPVFMSQYRRRWR